MAFEIRVDPNRCAGAMRCIYVAPAVFELGADGVAVVVDPQALPEAEVVAVATQCPNDAIVVERDGERLAGA